MSHPDEPQYPHYEGQPTGAVPHPSRPPGVLARLGERALRRPEPRLGISLAGAGIALAVLGALVWGGDFLTGTHGGGGGGDGSPRRLLGVGLSLVAVVAGYFLVATRRGPLATAGIGASALGVPLLLGFLTFDTSQGAGNGLPFSIDAVVLMSVLVWLVSYLAVPRARGHVFYLGLAAFAMWPYVIDKAEPGTFSLNLLVPVVVPDSAVFDTGTTSPDWTTVAALSLIFGVAYYLAAFGFDRSGRPGPGVARRLCRVLATPAGIAAAAINLHAIGTGVLLIVVGSTLAAYGALARRRFTTWAWSAGLALGASVIITKLAGDNAAASGIALIAVGVGVVLGGHLVSAALHEPDDVAMDWPQPVPATEAGR
jgi:hypothetical protein